MLVGMFHQLLGAPPPPAPQEIFIEAQGQKGPKT